METPITPPPVAPTPAPMTAPPMTPATPASSKRWLWISLIAVVVLAGTAYGWMKLYPATPVAEVSPSPSASVVATADPAAGRKTYTNTQYGFEFKYPSTWTVQEAQTADAKKAGIIMTASHATPAVRDYYNDLVISYWPDINDEYARGGSWAGMRTYSGLADYLSVKNSTKNSLGGITVAGVPGYAVSVGGMGMNYAVMIEKNGIYQIDFPSAWDASKLSEEQKTVLSTFKFTDPTAGWKTYTNTQYGFEVKYPADWKEIVGTASQATLSKVSLVKPAGPSEEFPDTLDISVLSLTVERLFSEAHPSYRNIESVQFAGISAQKFNNAPLESMGRADHTLIAVPRNGSLILLDYQTDADVNQILSTFKFSDPTAGWKTYTNTQYGYSFKYPSDWVIVPNGVNDISMNTTQQVFLRSPATIAGISAKTINLAYSYDLVVSYFSDGTAWAGEAGPGSPVNSGTTTAIGSIAAKDYIRGGQGQNYAAIIDQDFPKFWELSFETAWDKTKLTDTQRQILSTFKFTRTP